MKIYNHLSREQRYAMDRLLKQGKSYSFIAETIGVATSTVSREIRRNQIPCGRYSCRQVDTYASERKEWRYYPCKFTSKMRHDVEQIIRQQQWSPEQIAWREFPLWAKLPYTPFSIRTKMDLIIGAQQREAILTLTERKTGYAIIEKLPNGKNSKSLARVVNRSLAYFKRMGLLHSITTDNGSEFMAFRSIERALRIPVFFAKPYCSTDKPHVEWLNKLIRQYIPKGTSFKDINDKQIRNIRMLLNNRPRKSLDFKSPNEVLALLLSYRCT